MIKAVSFDLWNTLIFSNPEFRKARTKAIIENSEIKLTENFVNDTFNRLKDDIDSSVEKYGLQYEINDAYGILANQLGIAKNRLRILCEEAFLNNLPILRDDVLKTLKEIHKNYKLCISSNTVLISGNVLYRAVHKLGIGDYIHEYLFSDQLGFSKPNYKFFMKVQTTFGEFKNTILHVGDNMETDITGGIAFGLKTKFIKKNENFYDEITGILEFFNKL